MLLRPDCSSLALALPGAVVGSVAAVCPAGDAGLSKCRLWLLPLPQTYSAAC